MTKKFLGKDMAFGGGGVTWFPAGSEGGVAVINKVQ